MDLGFTGRQIERQIEVGQLRILHRGVYLLGPILSRHTPAMAAVLACSPRSALSHPSAAQLWGFLPYPADPGLVHVSVAGRNPGRHPGIRVHRTTSLRHGEVTVRHGVGVTTPARTILDLAGELRGRALERALAEAFALRLTDRARVLSLLDRHPGRPGIGVLRRLLDAHAARTRSPAEELLLSLIRASELPEPHVNARLGDWEVDFLWAAEQLVVEVDGFASHSSPEAFERDHAKSAELGDAGYVLLRFTWRQLREEPERTLARIRRAL